MPPASDGGFDGLVHSLDARRREVFVLTQDLGLSYAEAALVIGCPLGTVHSRRCPTAAVATDREHSSQTRPSSTALKTPRASDGDAETGASRGRCGLRLEEHRNAEMPFGVVCDKFEGVVRTRRSVHCRGPPIPRA